MRLPIALIAAGLATAAILRAEDAPSIVIESRGPAETVTTETETTITFRDHVVATDKDMRLACDYLKVVVLRPGDAQAAPGQSGSFKSLLATGHVEITRGTQVATCGRAEVSARDNRTVLSENPVLHSTEDNSSVAAYRIIFNRGQKNAVFESAPGQSVRAVLPPMKELGILPPEKAATPAETPPK